MKSGKSKSLEEAEKMIENLSKILVRMLPLVNSVIPYASGLMVGGLLNLMGNPGKCFLITIDKDNNLL